MTRAKREESEEMRPVEVGDVDTMSWLARSYGVPLCGRAPAGVQGAGFSCSRAAGHHEAVSRSAGSDHVATGQGYVVRKVWK